MPRISEINPETAPEAIQKIIADHLADGHALTAEKRTLLHNAAAFNAVEAGSYALDDELQRLIGKRAADFYEYAISQKNGCLVCSIYFQNLLKKNGIDFENFAFTPKEEILIEYGQAIAEDPQACAGRAVYKAEGKLYGGRERGHHGDGRDDDRQQLL